MNCTENILPIIGRSYELFNDDINRLEKELSSMVKASSFLVIGGAGSVGQAVVQEIFKRNPKCIHVVDISENNLVELVRDIRSSLGYIRGNFKTLPLDYGSNEFYAFVNAQLPYDYILNLAALKHVRSEKDPYTLMRMIVVNILNTEKSLQFAIETNCRKYFSVSTDKAVNPVNMMGATKQIMEMCLTQASQQVPVSTARFANVAFSDGSLLYGFTQRIVKKQPLSAPRDIKRYFITPHESGQLCLMSCLLGENRDLFFPKDSGQLRLIDFPTIAERYLRTLGFKPYLCNTEDEARSSIGDLLPRKLWPCYFFDSDTTGEKEAELFYTQNEIVDTTRFAAISVVKKPPPKDYYCLEKFLNTIHSLRKSEQWTKKDLIEPLCELLPQFTHKETFKYLDSRM